MAMMKAKPRGIRNNNPLNIRIGNVWLGEVNKPTDPAFEQFISMEYGIRAGFVILRRYIKRNGFNTIRKIISTWAPPSENNTATYIEFVHKQTGLNTDDVIRYQDKIVMCAIVSAMIRMECGEPVPMNVIQKAYDMA